MSLELARQLGRRAAMQKQALGLMNPTPGKFNTVPGPSLHMPQLGVMSPTPGNFHSTPVPHLGLVPNLGSLGASAASSLASPFQAKPAPAPASVNVKPQQGANFGGLWNAFQQHMQNPQAMGMLLGNPMMAPLTKGVLGMTGAPGLFGMTDLFRSGGSNFRSLLKGPIGSPPAA